MSRWADLPRPTRRRTRRRADDGFALIEVIVAIGIITVVLTALLPQLIVGIRSSGTSQLITQAKGIAQGQLERMRNLPYHVAPAAGDYRDVLDRYYRNLTPAGTPSGTPPCTTGGKYVEPQAGWTGYVSGAARCGYEPATGDFYRYVGPAPASGFSVVVDTQFLSGATPPTAVTPPPGYDTQVAGKDSPSSFQIGVTVTVLYADHATLKPVSTYTQIADQPTATSRIKLSSSAAAVEVGSVTTTNGALSLAAGLLNLSGALTYASTASGTLASTSAGLATGEQQTGASTTVDAPPSLTATTQLGSAGDLSSGCALACWGATQLDLAAMSAADGLPNVGSPDTPMQSLLTSDTNHGLSFSNSAPTAYRPGLDLDGPLVRLASTATASASGTSVGCGPGTTGATSYVNASGYLTSTGHDTTPADSVEACSVARTSTIALFPTTFAPQGVVQVELMRATARCQVTGLGHTPAVSYDYDAVVKYHDGPTGNYVTAAEITPALTTDTLAGMDLSTIAVGGNHQLGDYVASWSAFLSSSVQPTSGNGTAAVQLPAVFKLTSQPVRPGTEQEVAGDGTVLLSNVELASAVSFSTGAVGCSAQDAR